MAIVDYERSELSRVFQRFIMIAFLFMPLLNIGQTRDTTYFNPLIDDITQRIPPLEDLIDSAIVHNPQIKYYDADIGA